ncbi:hypothetical protein HHI36_014386, partial [Cryptolaemus montrouzieri]
MYVVNSLPAPQVSQHGQPQAGAVSTPVPGNIFPVVGGGGGGVGGIRRTLSGWREWRRADPTLIHSLWRSKMGNGIRKQLAKKNSVAGSSKQSEECIPKKGNIPKLSQRANNSENDNSLYQLKNNSGAEPQDKQNVRNRKNRNVIIGS